MMENVKDSSYTDFIDLTTTVNLHEPPLTKDYEASELLKQVENRDHLDLVPCPSNSQCVERWIKRVTEVSTKVTGYNKRHESLLNIQQNTAEMPTFHSKQDIPREVKKRRSSSEMSVKSKTPKT